MLQIKKIDTELDTAELVCTKTDGKAKYDFNLFASPLKVARKIHNYKITLNEVIYDQEKLENSIIRLENYKQKNAQKKEEKDKVLESAIKLWHIRNDIINAFDKKIFPYNDKEKKKTKEEKSEQKSEEKLGETSEEELKKYINNTFTFIKGE